MLHTIPPRPLRAHPSICFTLITLLAAVLSGPVVAQDAPALFPVYQDEAWGYIDKEGAVVIDPQYEEASPFSDGWARVREDGTFKFIDATGEVVLEPEALYVGPFSDGRAVVRLEEEAPFGYIDKEGQVVIEPRFDQAYAFSEGLAPVYTGDPTRAEPGFGYIDTEGAFVIEPRYWGARSFSGGLAPVLVGGFVGGTWGYIDEEGAMQIEPQFEQALPFSDGLAAVSVGDGFDAEWGYIDQDGQQVIAPRFEMARSFSDGLAPVEDAFGDWYYVDENGGRVFDREYAYAEPFSEGLARVSVESGGGGYASQGGPLQFMTGVPDGKWRYIDPAGERVWPVTFGTETASFEHLGYRVHYPSNWSASWGQWDDPFAETEQSAYPFYDVEPGETAPEDANALQFSGDEAPRLMIYAHRTAPQVLPDLVDVLVARFEESMSGGSTEPDFSMEADVMWGDDPAREIGLSYGVFGGSFYRIVRAGDVRYVATCKGAEPACRKALDEEVDLELIGVEAEPTSAAEKEQIAAVRPAEDPLLTKIKTLLPAEGLAGLDRRGLEEDSSPQGRTFGALYQGDEGNVMIYVALLGQDGREKMEDRFEQDEDMHRETYRGYTLYRKADDGSMFMLMESTGLGLRGDDEMTREDLLAILDALPLERLADLAE